MSATPPDEAPAQEVRVSVYAQRALRRWYVIVLTVIVAVGLVVLQGSNNVKGQTDATATVYMGQPVTPGGGALFANPPYANLSAVTKLITSLPARTAAAAAANTVKGKNTVTADSLASRVTAHQLSAGGTSTATKTISGPAYYAIEAQGPWSKQQVAMIANTLAKIVVTKASGYVRAKIAALTQRSPPSRRRSRGSRPTSRPGRRPPLSSRRPPARIRRTPRCWRRSCRASRPTRRR